MEVEPEVSTVATENAVRLMSIHQSKGLEFPIVVLADLAKNFNEQDLRAEIIFDEELGLCPKVKPPSSGRRYPSLPHWLAQRRQKRELRGEELRLLYVALTRARDNLILTASLTEKNWEEKWTPPQSVTVPKIADARSFADWLGLWFSSLGLAQGETLLLRWRLVDDAELANADKAEIGNLKPETGPAALDTAAVKKLRGVVDWSYPRQNATKQKAKSSVTELRRAAAELDDEAEKIFSGADLFSPPRRDQNSPPKISNLKSGGSKLSASEIGSAHHTFLQHVALEKTGDLAAEIQRLVRENYLSADESAALDLGALAKFWDSDLGEKIRAHAANVRRELPFTARFSPAEIAKITGGKIAEGLAEEFIVVQGVADLVVLLPDEIWLVDFKTDAVAADRLAEKIKTYAPQLQLYAAALEKIFTRQVTLRALHFLAAGRTEKI
jgi:ATP-dependent helicase/nuclease subunit A